MRRSNTPYGINHILFAKLVRHKKVIYPDLAIAEIIVWQLPNKTKERPHGYKYRLNYCDCSGKTIVRYDNETGKPDHKHIGPTEIVYEFRSLAKLYADFSKDVKNARKGL